MTNLIKKNLHTLRQEVFDPFEQQFNKIFNKLTEDFFTPSTKTTILSTAGGYPRLDVVEEDGHWVVKASIPGVAPEDVSVEVLPDNILQITGKMSEEYQSPEGSVHYIKELKKSSFIRQITIPDWAQDQEPKAVMKNGILKLSWLMPEHAVQKPDVKKIFIKSE